MVTATPVLALDLGTSSVRALGCDEHAEPVPGVLARREVEPHQDAAGAGELDPESYTAALVDCLDELHAAGALRDVTVVATSAQWHSVLAVDDDGSARSPALTWLDTRAPTDRQPRDPDAFHRRTGSWVHPLYWTTKIRWLSEHTGGRRFTGITEYVRARLLGDPDISISMASASGMLDVGSGVWDGEAMELAGIGPDALPRLSAGGARLISVYARRWPELADATWAPVAGDGATSTVGAGAQAGRSAGVNVGTSAAIRVVHPTAGAPALAPGLWRYRVDEHQAITGAAVSAGGLLHGWLRGLLGDLPDPGDEPGVASAGVVVLPWHAGSRPPTVVPGGSGSVVGLGTSTRPEQLVAATYEGVVHELRRSLDALDDAFGTDLGVVLGGGAVTASPWWRQAFAAGFERPVVFQAFPEVGARGAAALALGVGLPAPAAEVEASTEARDRMRAARRPFEQARTALLGIHRDQRG